MVFLRPNPAARTRRRRTLMAAALSTSVLVAGAVGVAQPASAAYGSGGCAPNNRFGSMLRGLPAAQAAPADLSSVARYITETSHLENLPATGKSKKPNSAKAGKESDDESDIDAGYTYVGQFIDHDIVLDPRPDTLTGKVDPATLINRRTPNLDLDSVYGLGPTSSREFYKADRFHLKRGAVQDPTESDPMPRDLVRGAYGMAVIGDARNDENRIVASFHSLMTRFHNKIADDVRAAHPNWSAEQVYNEARLQVTWYYQWAILTDFLPQMSGKSSVEKVAKRSKSAWQTNLRYYNACSGSMPIEFSAAAYRWHTMVRNDYEINDQFSDLPVFSTSGANLAGFSPAPRNFGFDWDYFFSGGNRSAQKAYKFDNSLVPALGILPGGAAGAGPVNLSERNLLRGLQLSLPSGQSIARALGNKVLRDDQVIVGPALGKGAPTKALTSFSRSFAGNSPLWVYLAAESVNAKYTMENGTIVKGDSHALRLGPTGALIVNETLVGLMANDPASVLNHPEFTPDPVFEAKKNAFTFRDLIEVAISPDRTPCGTEPYADTAEYASPKAAADAAEATKAADVAPADAGKGNTDPAGKEAGAKQAGGKEAGGKEAGGKPADKPKPCKELPVTTRTYTTATQPYVYR